MLRLFAKTAAGFVVGLAAVGLAQDVPAGDHPSTITVYAREVVLDVVAIDAKGRSVTGLKPSDFQVVEDGVPLPVRAASEHHAMTSEEVAAITPAKLPVNTFSSFVPDGNTNSVNVILIDALDSPLVAQMYLREQLKAFMKSVPPGNVYAIFELDRQLHLVQGFTSDPDMLLKAVTSKRESVKMQDLGTRGNSAARDQIREEAFHVLGSYLAGIPGRKNLIWFTGPVPRTVFGLKRNPFPEVTDFDMRKGRSANALSLSRVAMYPIDDRGLKVYDWGRSSQGDLEEVANATGGRAYYNTNGLKEALAQITQTGSNYYTIAYAPTNPVWRAHHRDVVITIPGRRDVTLLYRHRYYAKSEKAAQKKRDAKEAAKPFKPEAAGDAVQTAGLAADSQQDFGTAMRLGAVPSGEVLFNLGVTAEKASLKLNKGEPAGPGNFLREDLLTKPFRQYQMRFSVDPSRVEFEMLSDGRRRAELELAAVVYDPEGEILNSFEIGREIVLDEAQYEKAMDGTLLLDSNETIAVPAKGSYFLRAGVHDLNGETVGTVEVPVDTVQLGVDVAGMVAP